MSEMWIPDWRRGAYEATLPDGQYWTAEEAGHREVWARWRGAVSLALARNEGVRVTVEEDGAVSIEAVYAPLWETSRIVVYPNGQFEWCGEQSAPMIEPGGTALPWLRESHEGPR